MVWTVFMIPVVAIICVFTFVSVATWAENRRKEREAYYRAETYQKMLDGSPESAETVRQLIREAEERHEVRRKENLKLGLKLGGLITTVAGLGVGVFLRYLIPDEPIWMVCIIPVLIGPVLALYGYRLSGEDAAAGSG
ncbi:MAG: hypothetical protein ACE5EG_02095 [Thermoanaerobaculia bacterium]